MTTEVTMRASFTGEDGTLWLRGNTYSASERYAQRLVLDGLASYVVPRDPVYRDDSGSIVLPQTTGVGLKVDDAAPTFGWRDITGDVTTKGLGAANPTFATYRTPVSGFQFSVDDEAWFTFHMPHDWVPGSDLFIHAHWSHIATTVTSGSVSWAFTCLWARGFDQAAFSAPVTATATQDASTTQYQHMIAEVQLTAASPTANQIDTDLLEVDGILLVHCKLSANSMNGTPEPFLHTVDIHYQSTNMATKNKAPTFYG